MTTPPKDAAPTEAISPEAKKAAEQIIWLLGVGHVNDINFTIQRAITAAVAEETKRLREALEVLAKGNVQADRDSGESELGAAMRYAKSALLPPTEEKK